MRSIKFSGLPEHGDWLPDTWNPEGQIQIIDDQIAKLKEWVKVVRSQASILKQITPSVVPASGGGQYEPSHGTIIEDMDFDEYDDFDTLLDYEINGWFPGSQDWITYDEPNPTSDTLIDLEELMSEAMFAPIDELMSESDYRSAVQRWIDMDVDPQNPTANLWTISDYLEETANEMETKVIPAISDMKKLWIDEVNTIANDYKDQAQKNLQSSDPGARAISLASKIENVGRVAFASLDKSTGEKASNDMAKYLTIMKGLLGNVETTTAMGTEDVMFMEDAVDDLTEIANRNFARDVRSWESKAVQRDDAKIVMDKVRRYWSKRKTSLGTEKSDRVKKAMYGVPSYRFKVGQMVRVRQSKRYGKVLGSQLEGGTGKQVYEVRVNGMDFPQKYYLSDIERAD